MNHNDVIQSTVLTWAGEALVAAGFSVGNFKSTSKVHWLISLILERTVAIIEIFYASYLLTGESQEN